MKLGELFAGYGGLGMAVEEVFGAELTWVSEFEEAPSKILKHHWPNVPNHGDITKIDWRDAEPVDIISGGSPCQDLSLAGKRRGMTEGTRSNLWESMREGIAIIRPKYVVWENVRGALSAGAISDLEQSEGRMGDDGNPNLRAIGRVLGDLADLGYDAEWRGVRAADVGGCHGRFRVFVLARRRATEDANLAARSERREPAPGQAEGGRARPHPGGRDRTPTAHAHDAGRGEQRRSITVQPEYAAAEYTRTDAPDAESFGRGEGRPEPEGIERGSDLAVSVGTNWGEYEPAIRRWERVLGRAAPRPTEPTGRNGGQRLSPKFTEWMMGLPDGWVTDPAIGISRNEQLKACGNGVVPQQAIAALTDMLAAFQTLAAAA